MISNTRLNPRNPMFTGVFTLFAGCAVAASVTPSFAGTDVTAGVDFGPKGTVLNAKDKHHRYLDVPTADGHRRVDLVADARCSQQTGQERAVVADVTGDASPELVVFWTWCAGAGPMAAVDYTDVCIWEWEDDTAKPMSEEITRELSALRLLDVSSIRAHLATRDEAADQWIPVEVRALPDPDEHTRRVNVGTHTMQMKQTGRYNASVSTVGEQGDEVHVTDVYGLGLVGLGASRPYDFKYRWEPLEFDGEPACCAFDMSRPDRPRFTQAWTHKGVTYVLMRQEQSPSTTDCRVLQMTQAGGGRHAQSCEAFLAARNAEGRTLDKPVR